MSFDIFLQRFDDAPSDVEIVERLLRPIASGVDAAGQIERITTADGGSEVYGDGVSGLMFTNASGRAVFDVIVELARVVDWVILPTGCGTVLVKEDQRSSLPDGVPDPVVVIGSGEQLIAHIEQS